MPGKASLRAGEYYAFPRNAFWSIMCELLSISAGLDYDQRCQALRQHRVAVWDVLKTCTRTSSLDSDIDPASIVPNDFVSLLEAQPSITVVFFNGATAEQVFRRHVLPDLGDLSVGLQLVRLPSTSPANASWSYERKRDAWQRIGTYLLE